MRTSMEIDADHLDQIPRKEQEFVIRLTQRLLEQLSVGSALNVIKQVVRDSTHRSFTGMWLTGPIWM